MAPRLVRYLNDPWVDRLIGAVAVSPFAVTVVLVMGNFKLVGFNLPGIAYLIQYSLATVTMIARRPPKRISFDPWYWALTFLTTYWGFLIMGFLEPGVCVLPGAATDAVAVLSLLGVVWGRLSLGRNIGCVPAQRDLVTEGPYRYVRHPIYAAMFLGLLGFALQIYSPRNAVLIGVGVVLTMVKSVTEERFLAQDPAYASYMERVRWRWLPGVM
jgi:protein-S-isoprenylcysteine O-methyltransferase Ste14